MQVKYILQRCELFMFIQDNFKVAPEHQIDDISFKVGSDNLVDMMEIICVEKKSCDIELVQGSSVDIPWEKDIAKDELFWQTKQVPIRSDGTIES